MPAKLFNVILWAIFCLITISCKSSMPEKEKAILLDSKGQPRPSVHVIDEMSKLSLEDRFDVYYYGMRSIAPSRSALAEGLVPLGKKSIPFLSEKLTSTKNNYEIEVIVYLLSKMAIYGCYDVRSDQKLMDMIVSRKDDVVRSNPKRVDSPLLDIRDLYSYGKYKNGFGESGQKIICE